ncbi:hypothetical protein CC86DRAFT_410567 [Ophiobolus disseminans]|uniref:Transmembrane protein n=1 Tax=Ophiobolus disseminans TaxID=1469910 RepID=A0A6A6ZPG6_9PLEO|nr:hypothetical protein CC86DRAFT_410567 [Ophiobolus disseminans]
MSSQKLAFAARHFSKDHAPYTTHQCAYNADKWSRARKELSAYVASRVGGEQAKLLEQAHTAKTPEETAQAITDAKKFDDEEFRNGVAVCVMLCVLAGCAGYVLWITESAMREIEEREKKEVEEMRKERDRKRDKEEKKEFEEEKMAWDRMWRGLSGVGSEECKQV